MQLLSHGCMALLKSIYYVFPKQTTAYDVWQNLENVFQTNKENTVIQFDNELGNITIGASIVIGYCNHIKNLADLLDNMDVKVPEPNFAAYTLNGLSPKFTIVIHYPRFGKFIICLFRRNNITSKKKLDSPPLPTLTTHHLFMPSSPIPKICN